MSAMVEMSRAIRLTVEQYAPSLTELPSDVLHDFALIVGAFALDLQSEVKRRVDADAA